MIGKEILNYTIVSLIGKGGMGQSILQQGDIVEAVTHGCFQILNHWQSPSGSGQQDPAPAPERCRFALRPWPASPRYGRPKHRRNRAP